jgi:preprotein translocase subunit SecE
MAKTIAVTEQPSTGLQQLKTQPARLAEFLKDVRSEMRKVISPSRAEVQSTTTVVLITVSSSPHTSGWSIPSSAGRLKLCCTV